jgi:hypothetical protein
MRAPTSPSGPGEASCRSADEIVQDIFKLGVRRTIALEQLARQLIRNLVGYKPPAFGNRRENARYLQKLRNDINRLRRTLGQIPNDNLFLTLFAPELKIWTPDSRASSFAQALDAMMEDAKSRHGKYVLVLAVLGDRCGLIADARPGKHKRYGFQQYRAAMAARVFLVQAGEKATSGSWKSLYRRLTSLFNEAATGEQGADMERACDEVLRLPLTVAKKS